MIACSLKVANQTILHHQPTKLKSCCYSFQINQQNDDNESSSNWTKKKVQRDCFDAIAEKLNINMIEEWYSVRHEDIVRNGGGSLLKQQYKNSHTEALTFIYPHTQWQIWRFATVPKYFWQSLENRRNFLEHLMHYKNIVDLDQCYSITKQDIEYMGGISFLL
jgi:hypothetical protein